MLTYCRYFENKSLTSSHPKSCMICSTHIWCNCRHSQCRTRLDSWYCLDTSREWQLIRILLSLINAYTGRQDLPHMLWVQLLVEQSVWTRHSKSIAHGLHVSPPQSTSVSAPFWTLSSQAGPANNEVRSRFGSVLLVCLLQREFKQYKLVQSSFVLHCLFSAQGSQSVPPQSTSVSKPFLMLSLHVALAGNMSVVVTKEMMPYSTYRTYSQRNEDSNSPNFRHKRDQRRIQSTKHRNRGQFLGRYECHLCMMEQLINSY